MGYEVIWSGDTRRPNRGLLDATLAYPLRTAPPGVRDQPTHRPRRAVPRRRRPLTEAIGDRLALRPRQSAQEIADALHMPVEQVRDTLERMRQRGCARVVSPAYARPKRWIITAEGRKDVAA